MASDDVEGLSPLQCTLRDWNALRLHLLFAYDQTLLHGEADGDYTRHGEYSAWLIKSGRAELRCDNERAAAETGQWILCFGSQVRQKLAAGTRMLSLRFANSWANDAPMFVSERSIIVFEASRYPQLESMATRILSEPRLQQRLWYGRGDPALLFGAETRMDLVSYLRHQHTLLDWTECVAGVLREQGWSVRVPRGVDSRLADVLNLLDTRPYAEPFPSRKMLASGGVSFGQLNRLCVRYLGQTLHAYWEQRRLTRSQILLNQPSARIKEVAADMGFRRLSHFSTWFKRHAGKSPRDYVRSTIAGPSSAGLPSAGRPDA